MNISRALLEAVSATVGESVVLGGATELGESRSTYLLASPSGDLFLKVTPDAPDARANSQRLLQIVGGLRARGYPAPEYLGAGRAAGEVFTIQRRMPGQPLAPPTGGPPNARTFEAVLPDLLAAIELQRDAGDLPCPPWPMWLRATIDHGGDGYCIHDTMRQRANTAALLARLQQIAERNWSGMVCDTDVLHFDLNPANVLHEAGRLSGVVDWNVPFVGASQGDRGFDVATLLFYTYDLDATRGRLWTEAVEISGLSWTAVYLCHLCLRQVEWTLRHRPDSAEESRFIGVATSVLDECERRGV